jgi:hypothetical protein
MDETGSPLTIENLPSERLAEYLKTLTPEQRKGFFDKLRVGIYGPDKDKLILPPDMRNLNLSGLQLRNDVDSDLLLGEINGFSVRRIQHKRSETDVANDLSYQTESNLLRGSFGVMNWYWKEQDQPVNYHREISDGVLRGKGMGTAMLKFSEEAFLNMGFKELRVETAKPATASWFFRQGFEPADVKDIEPKFLEAIRNRENDFDKLESIEITLRKRLQ